MACLFLSNKQLQKTENYLTCFDGFKCTPVCHSNFGTEGHNLRFDSVLSCKLQIAIHTNWVPYYQCMRIYKLVTCPNINLSRNFCARVCNVTYTLFPLSIYKKYSHLCFYNFELNTYLGQPAY